MKGRSASKIKLTSYDELLGGGEETNDIQQVSLEHLHSFENHPFQVNDDAVSYTHLRAHETVLGNGGTGGKCERRGNSYSITGTTAG